MPHLKGWLHRNKTKQALARKYRERARRGQREPFKRTKQRRTKLTTGAREEIERERELKEGTQRQLKRKNSTTTYSAPLRENSKTTVNRPRMARTKKNYTKKILHKKTKNLLSASVHGPYMPVW
jgi:hypothetical protein